MGRCGCQVLNSGAAVRCGIAETLMRSRQKGTLSLQYPLS